MQLGDQDGEEDRRQKPSEYLWSEPQFRLIIATTKSGLFSWRDFVYVNPTLQEVATGSQGLGQGVV